MAPPQHCLTLLVVSVCRVLYSVYFVSLVIPLYSFLPLPWQDGKQTIFWLGVIQPQFPWCLIMFVLRCPAIVLVNDLIGTGDILFSIPMISFVVQAYVRP